ncbi:SIMPL domain-containing protein [Clostridium sp.]|uniref:SIMPL domain-containing protein n=1 Tax=Clostridium sp. TaxID=1506 RepID=UPI002606944D|nr:SIMPL domain-containing protein [Clostridium sp.]
MNLLRDNDIYSSKDDDRAGCDNKLRVFGKGVVSVKPDSAEAIVGIVTENIQLQAAQEENARITTQVINSLVKIGVLPKYIQTENYNIRANYDYINGRQVFRGYEVSNNLKVQINDVNSAGQVIDTAVRNGANTVSGITFIVSNESKFYYEALGLALEDAQNKAVVMANELKVKVNIIPIKVNEQYKGNITPLPVMTFKSTSAGTPIEAGENKITADIEAVFILSE